MTESQSSQAQPQPQGEGAARNSGDGLSLSAILQSVLRFATMYFLVKTFFGMCGPSSRSFPEAPKA